MRLIDADAFEANMQNEWERNEISNGEWIHFREMLKDEPTIEQPVRMKGKWERHYSRPNVYADMYWHCSICGYKNSNNWANIYHRYCPHCGSEMEEEKHKSEFYFPSDDADMRGEEDER